MNLLHKDFRLGIIGAGRMGNSLILGLINKGWNPKKILLSSKSPQSRLLAEKNYRIQPINSNEELIKKSSTVVLAVKPQVFPVIFPTLIPSLKEQKPLLISTMAGISLKYMCKNLGPEFPIVRTMPNSPGRIGAGITTMLTHSHMNDKLQMQCEEIMKVLGSVLWIRASSIDEGDRLMDLITALSGSGPAYFYYLFESLEKSAVKMGLSPEIARQLILQTAIGSAQLSEKSQTSFSELINQVRSPGGTTEAGLKVMDHDKFEDTIDRVIKAAYSRARELSL